MPYPYHLRLLLDHGANINAGLHEYGVSALHCAVRANAIDHVAMLLRLGAIPNNVQGRRSLRGRESGINT